MQPNMQFFGPPPNPQAPQGMNMPQGPPLPNLRNQPPPPPQPVSISLFEYFYETIFSLTWFDTV